MNSLKNDIKNISLEIIRLRDEQESLEIQKYEWMKNRAVGKYFKNHSIKDCCTTIYHIQSYDDTHEKFTYYKFYYNATTHVAYAEKYATFNIDDIVMNCNEITKEEFDDTKNDINSYFVKILNEVD